MKFHLLWALLALALLAATSYAQDAPPACVGDQCSVSAAAPAVQSSIVVKRTVILPRVREVQPARKLAGAAVKGAKCVGKGLQKAAEVALPPYPRVRQRVRCALLK